MAKVKMKYTTITLMAAFTPSSTLSNLPAPIFCPQYVAIAMPRFSNTQVKRYFIRIDAVKAATYIVPNALLALCSITIPMPVIENCKPIGTPLLSNMLTFLLSYSRSLPCGMSICICFLMFSAKFCLKKVICLKMKYIQFPKRAFWDTPFRCEG